jgi:YbbR domain-containing protein
VAYPVVYDRNGDIIENSFFEFSTEVLAVTGKSYPIKEIPLNISVNSDSVNGYTVSSVKFEPENIKIAGTEEFLANINELAISMDVNLNPDSLVNNQFVKTLKVAENLPNGAYFVNDSDEIVVTLTFEEYKTKSITFEKSKVELRGLIPDCKAELGDEEFSITISGDDEILKQISKDSIIPYIDLSGLEIGEYNLIMQFVGLDDVILTSNISAKVIITERG